MTNLEKILEQINRDPVGFFTNEDDRCCIIDRKDVDERCKQYGFCTQCIRDWLDEEADI